MKLVYFYRIKRLYYRNVYKFLFKVSFTDLESSSFCSIHNYAIFVCFPWDFVSLNFSFLLPECLLSSYRINDA